MEGQEVAAPCCCLYHRTLETWFHLPHPPVHRAGWFSHPPPRRPSSARSAPVSRAQPAGSEGSVSGATEAGAASQARPAATPPRSSPSPLELPEGEPSALYAGESWGSHGLGASYMEVWLQGQGWLSSGEGGRHLKLGPVCCGQVSLGECDCTAAGASKGSNLQAAVVVRRGRIAGLAVRGCGSRFCGPPTKLAVVCAALALSATPFPPLLPQQMQHPLLPAPFPLQLLPFTREQLQPSQRLCQLVASRRSRPQRAAR